MNLKLRYFASLTAQNARVTKSITRSRAYEDAVRGRRSCIVLGAGASHAYEDGTDRLPLQRGFFEYVRYYCMTPPVRNLVQVATTRNFSSFAIRFLGGTTADPWAEISNNTVGPNNDLGLEQAYKRIFESDISEADKKVVVESLNCVLYTTIAAIVIERLNPAKICRYHRRLAELLEPGDLVISFNYDCLIDDAMMHSCPFWYPRTGYGVPIEAVWGRLPGDKAEDRVSTVSLLHPHGSILFRTDWSVAPERGGIPAILLLGLEAGIQTMSTPTAALVRGADGLYDLVAAISVPPLVSWESQKDGTEKGAEKGREDPSDSRRHIQRDLVELEPLIVYPTPTKEQAYFRRVAQVAGRMLVEVEFFCFVGYSLPSADRHAPQVFPIDTMRTGKVVVVNAAGNEDWLQQNYREAFPDVAIEFAAEQFQEWVFSV